MSDRPTELPYEVPRAEWQQFLQDLTRERAGDEVTLEVLDPDLGDEVEVERLPLAYIEYDPKDDEVNVAVDGRDGRDAVVLREGAAHPQQIVADTLVPAAGGPPLLVLEVTGADGTQTIVTLHPATGADTDDEGAGPATT